MSEERWAIQDSATGEWWNNVESEWSHSSNDATSSVNYHHIARWYPLDPALSMFRESARIVPAPPREMTDEECWEWLIVQNRPGANPWVIARWDTQQWAVCSVQDGGALRAHSRGDTPCDAIRAARKALEGGK